MDRTGRNILRGYSLIGFGFVLASEMHPLQKLLMFFLLFAEPMLAVFLVVWRHAGRP